MRILLSIVLNAAALYATTIVPGIRFKGGLLTLFIAGVLFGLFNAIIRPIALFLSIPFLILPLGIFYFILNGILLWVAAGLIPGYQVDGFVPAFLGGLVFMVVNWVLDAIVPDERKATA
jgi:putative membrane protein